MNDHVGCSLLKFAYSSVTISLGSLVSEHFEIAALNPVCLGNKILLQSTFIRLCIKMHLSG